MTNDTSHVNATISLAAILVFASFNSCQAEQAQQAANSKPSVQMQISAEARKVTAGSLVVETLTVTNIGTDHVNFTVINATTDTELSVVSPDGKLLAISPAGKTYIFQYGFPNRRIFKNLAPGGVYSEKMFPSKLFDFSKPGLYKITASRDFTVGPDQHVEHITSNTDTIEITAPVNVKTDKTNQVVK